MTTLSKLLMTFLLCAVMLAALVLFASVSASSLIAQRANNQGADHPNQPNDIGEFVAFCPPSHRAGDDPVVLPNMPGMSHSHDFMGNVSVAATSTITTMLMAGTTCDPLPDLSAYWVPTLYTADNQVIPIEKATIYYTVEIDDKDSLQPFPVGLTVIAGSAKAATPPNPGYFKWSCEGENLSSTTDFVICPVGSKLEMLLDFADCWDGLQLDSADHKSHMAYSSAHACPATHPVAVPRLQFKLKYASTGVAGMKLSSGPAYTMHGDFVNAWDVDALANRMNCLYTLTKCGVEGYPDNAPVATVTSTPTSMTVATATSPATSTSVATLIPTATTQPSKTISIFLPLVER